MYVEIGTYLRQAREAIGLTLDDVQEKTKIQKSFLIAIEKGDFDKLPSPFYVRTYLRYYANCVRVEPHHILRAYRKAEQAIRYGIEPSSQSSQNQNTTRIPIINLNTGPQQSVAQTSGKQRRINAQTALTIAKVPQTTGKIPQTTGTNPKLSLHAQESGQRFATGPQQAFGNTQKLPTISGKPGQSGQTTQKMSAITQKLPTISRKMQNTDPGRSHPNLQNTGKHPLFNTGPRPAMAGQAEAAASAEQLAQTNPNHRFHTNPRLNTNPRVGLEQSIPPQKTGSVSSASSAALENTFGNASRLRRSNTNPPQPPANYEPEAEERQSARNYRRGGTRKSGFSIPKNRLMPIAITVAALSVFILGMIFLFGDDGPDPKAHKPGAVEQAPVQSKAKQEASGNAGTAADVKVEHAIRNTYVIKGAKTVEIEVIPVSGDSNVALYDGNPEAQNLKPNKIDDGTASQGAAYKHKVELTEEKYHVYIQLDNPNAVKVKINGTEIKSADVIRITLPGHV